MKNILFIAMILCLCASALAESKTEVIVKDGIVKTSTDQGDSLIKPGQKAVLKDGQEPAVTLNNKIVQKLLELDRQIMAERNMSTEKIQHTSAQIYSIDNENTWKMGVVVTQVNMSDKPTNELRIGPTSVLNDAKVFNLEGKPIQYKMEKINEEHAYYYIYFDEDVEPGKDFKFLAVMNLSEGMDEYDIIKKEMLTKQDGQWRIRNQNDTAYCLNYMHYVLPKTAVFVKSDPSAQTIEEQDGRVSITIRRYVGSEGHGPFYVYFLWPEKDGACLSGIPWTNAGPEAVDIYDMFLADDIKSPALWGELAIKLVGGNYYEQAYDALDRCYNGNDSALWDYTALTWQGHLHDLWQQREQALEKYQKALELKQSSGDMRHDQWDIVLDENWIKHRITVPFNEYMILYPELNYRQPPIDSMVEPGLRIGDLYLDMTKDQVLEKLGKPEHIFYNNQQYTLDNLPDQYCMAYPDYGVLVENNKVFELTTGSAFYRLPNGIRVGDSQQQVIEAFGTNYEYQVRQGQTDVLRYEDLGLKFEISKTERTVARTEVFRLK